ncbi:MAG: DUF4976 domain-containing protein [Crenarchaeota archaeon]|nr:MAG: DUF4976 domain-containing protein [Thermoproteota archaeon]RDJ33309.1 MAG: DUF4976 domain-containing protein [Thermoproteota archaeon]RDJ38819.1 MAG: DUF4976 domain-containing protein [Thermoproteota archaeon]
MKKYNVIFILVDGCRVDRIHKTPIFEQLQSQGTFFSQMISYAPYTLASMNSIFTGMYGTKNGVDAYYKMFKLNESSKTIAEYLSENGWYTQGDAMRLSLVSDRGFDKITEHDEKTTNYEVVHCDMLDEIVEKSNGNPFFAYLHYPKIHTSIVEAVFSKYDDFSDEYFAKKNQNLNDYDSYLSTAGHYLETIFEKIRSLNLEKDSIIIVMADHGMGVGEKKGERAYGVYTYDYSIKSFSIFLQPAIFPKGKKISDLTRTIDVMPTILDILEISHDQNYQQMQGMTLLPLLDGKIKKSFFSKKSSQERFAFSETGGLYGPWPSPNEPNVKCIRTNKWKLIHNTTPNTWEFYNLENDPGENNNIYDENSKTVKELQKKLEQIQNE